MSSPFGHRRVPEPVPQPTEREGTWDDNPRLNCRRCGKPIARQEIPPYAWVHEDDEPPIDLKDILSSPVSMYDHEAEPDVIDVKEIP